MAYDKDKPASSTSLRASNPEILANYSALETALNREHEFSTGGTVADQAHHKKGSARCFIQDAEPATRRDGSAFTAEDNGSLWIDTNSSPDNKFNFLEAFAGPTWTPISTEVIAVLLAAARVFASTLGVTGTLTASGAVTVGTTLDVTGNIDPTTYETTNGGFLDEDAMGSNAADKVASQQSIKAYADTKEAAIVTQATAGLWGTRVTTDGTPAALVKDEVYQAECDGIVTVYRPHAGGDSVSAGLTDGANPPTTVLAARATSSITNKQGGFSVHVRKDDYVKITMTNVTPTIYWLPFGTGDLVDQNP